MNDFFSNFFLSAINGLMWGAVIALIAAGLVIVFNILSIVNLAHGDFYMLGAVFAFYIIDITDSFWLAVLLSPMLVGLFAILFFRLFLHNSSGNQVKYIVATFGLSQILQNTVLFIFGGAPTRIDSPITTIITIFGLQYPLYRIAVAMFSIMIFIVLLRGIEKTKLGLWVRATGQNATFASMLGIPIENVAILSFGMAGVLAGLAGVLAAPTAIPGLDMTVSRRRGMSKRKALA